jgi:hypothetical protein
MATLDFIIQAVTARKHAAEVAEVISLGNPTSVILSVAFARKDGVSAIEVPLRRVARVCKVFVGIRNDITSTQALNKLLSLGVCIYAVDTGSRHRIFHPKVYLSKTATHGRMLIGSANLTLGGLHNNIEASAIVKCDLRDPADRRLLSQVSEAFTELSGRHPEHVFEVRSEAEVEALYNSGRLISEEDAAPPQPRAAVRRGQRDSLSAMALSRAVTAPAIGRRRNRAPAVPVHTAATVGSRDHGGVLVWKSKPLTRRDLNIPRADGTNQTGSMGFKKGFTEGIDQRHYFREEVFASLPWVPDGQGSVWERSRIEVDLVVKNIAYGTYFLKLSHNMDRTSASYRQKNFMTQLHWGEAKEDIAKEDLLGRTLYLYRRDTVPPKFVIEID